MRVITSKQSLVDCLGIVSKAVSSHPFIQVLSGILLEAGDGGIVLSATDMEISIRAPLLGKVERPGSLVIPARIVADIARSLPAGDVPEQAPGENHMQIRSAGSVFDLHSLPAADFPQLPVCSGRGSRSTSLHYWRRSIEWRPRHHVMRRDRCLREYSSS